MKEAIWPIGGVVPPKVPKGSRSLEKSSRLSLYSIFQWATHLSEDFSLLVAFLLVTFSWLYVVFSWLFRGPLLSGKTVFGPFSLLFRGFFVAFSWLFRGPRFGQILRVLALELSSEPHQMEQLLKLNLNLPDPKGPGRIKNTTTY